MQAEYGNGSDGILSLHNGLRRKHSNSLLQKVPVSLQTTFKISSNKIINVCDKCDKLEKMYASFFSVFVCFCYAQAPCSMFCALSVSLIIYPLYLHGWMSFQKQQKRGKKQTKTTAPNEEEKPPLQHTIMQYGNHVMIRRHQDTIPLLFNL